MHISVNCTAIHLRTDAEKIQTPRHIDGKHQIAALILIHQGKCLFTKIIDYFRMHADGLLTAQIISDFRDHSRRTLCLQIGMNMRIELFCFRGTQRKDRPARLIVKQKFTLRIRKKRCRIFACQLADAARTQRDPSVLPRKHRHKRPVFPIILLIQNQSRNPISHQSSIFPYPKVSIARSLLRHSFSTRIKSVR